MDSDDIYLTIIISFSNSRINTFLRPSVRPSVCPFTHTTIALPFLSNTEVFLFPLCVVVFIFLLNLVGYPFGFGWNASRIMAHLYFESS